MCYISVNSVVVSSNISCNDLYQDFIIMYVWYFVSRNSISVEGAIWPSLSPCTVINPILLTYLLTKFHLIPCIILLERQCHRDEEMSVIGCIGTCDTASDAIFPNITSLKRKCNHFYEIFINGCTESCRNNTFWCSQWWKCHPNDDISVPMIKTLYGRFVQRAWAGG